MMPRRRSMGRPADRVLLVVALLATAGCDSGPSGPGTLIATVDAEGLGGALLEVSGRGITGFDGLDDTRVYDAELANARNTYRVLLIDPTGGPIRFEIHVEDVGMDDPVISVVSAAGVDNGTRQAAGITTRIER